MLNISIARVNTTGPVVFYFSIIVILIPMVPKMLLLNGAVVDVSTPVISISFFSLYSRNINSTLLQDLPVLNVQSNLVTEGFTHQRFTHTHTGFTHTQIWIYTPKLLTALGTSDTSTWKFSWDYQFIPCTK